MEEVTIPALHDLIIINNLKCEVKVSSFSSIITIFAVGFK